MCVPIKFSFLLIQSYQTSGVSADEESVGLDISMHNESMAAIDTRKAKISEIK